jgi:hypothetical protein
MKKPKIVMTVLKEDSGYSASAKMKDVFIGTQGEDMEELKKNIIEAVNLAFEDKRAKYEISEITLKLDLQSFFDFYKVINAKALSERIKMDKKLLTQYISGEKKPSATQAKRIFRGVQQMGKELAAIQYFL